MTRDRDLIRWVGIGLIAAVLMLPALLAPPMSHDSFWIDRVWSEQFTALLRAGNLYPRWLPWSYGGLGSPAFYFYAPLSFHLAGAFGLAGLPTYPALLAAFASAWVASGAVMYWWLKGHARRAWAGAFLYMVLPYHVMDFYARGALAEFCAFGLVPLVALGVRKAVMTGRFVTLALAYATLIMTHLPSAVIVGVLLIAPYAAWSARHAPRLVLPVVEGCAIGIGIAGIYLVPALTLQRYSSVGALWSVKFLRPVSWSMLHPELWTSMSYVLLFAGLALAIVIATIVLARKAWGFWPVWTIGICIILTGLVPGFWSLPVLSAVQFPWRSLVLAEFGLATVAASYRGSPVVTVAALVPLLALSLLMASPANPMHGEPMQPLPVPGRQDVIEYLPAGAVGPDRTPRLNRIRQAVAAAQRRPGSVFPFPSLHARCGNGSVVPLVRDANGALAAAPTPNCHLSVERLPAERIGLAITLISLLLLAARGRVSLVVPARRPLISSPACSTCPATPRAAP